MAVGAEGVAIPHPLGFVLTVVSVSFQYFSQRANAAPQPGTAAVVFKPDNRAAAGHLPETESIVPDHPLLPPDRVEINCSQKLAFLTFCCLIIMSHHLIAAADTQKCPSVFQRRPYIRAFLCAQILQQYLLIEILSSANEEKVISSQAIWVPQFYIVYSASDSAPFQPLLQAEDVTSVSIQVEHVRIEVADFQFHFSSPFLLIGKSICKIFD